MQMYSEGEKQLFLHFAKNLISDMRLLNFTAMSTLQPKYTVFKILLPFYLKRNSDLTHWCQEVEDADQAYLGS